MSDGGSAACAARRALFARDRWSVMYDPEQPLRDQLGYYQLPPDGGSVEAVSSLLARVDRECGGVPAVLGRVPRPLSPAVLEAWRLGEDAVVYRCWTVVLGRGDLPPRQEEAPDRDREPGVHITRLGPEDLESALTLLGAPAGAQSRAEYLLKSIASAAPTLCARDGRGKVVGVCQIHLDARTVGGLAVAVEHRRRGLATELVRRCVEEHLDARPDVDKVNAVIQVGNEASLRTFEGLGFLRIEDEHVWIAQ